MFRMLPAVVPVTVDDLINVEDVTGLDVVVAIAVIIAGLVLGRLVRRIVLTKMPFMRDVPDHMALTVARTAGYAVVFLCVVYAMSLLGIDTGPMVLVILLIVIVAFFSLKPLLENYAAGLIIQSRSPFAVGDEILLAEYAGRVKDINARTVVIDTAEGEEVRLPNTQVIGGTLVNLTSNGARRSSIDVGVAYGTDLPRARTVIETAVGALALVHDTPPPRAGLHSFDESAITFEVRYWHSPFLEAAFDARDEVVEAIEAALKADGIAIPFPQRDIWMRNAPSGSPDTATHEPDASE